MPFDAKLIACLGRLFKMHPDFDAIIYEILKEAPNAYIVLVSEKVTALTHLLWKRMSVSVRPFVKRIRYISFAHFNSLLLYSSVVLDTYPYGGISYFLGSNSFSLIT